MKKKLIAKPPEPKPVCCKKCLVKSACSIEDWRDCPEAWSEIMKKGSFVYWPSTIWTTKEGLIEDGYSEDDAELLSQILGLIRDISKGNLTLRPATKYDRNVVKFVVTE